MAQSLGRDRERQIVGQELLAAEECDAGPVYELGEIFLGVNQGVVLPFEIGVKMRSAI
jgi:hypothetical protein